MYGTLSEYNLRKVNCENSKQMEIDLNFDYYRFLKESRIQHASSI